MSTLIKEIPITGKQQALDVITALSAKYHLIATDPDNGLDVSNQDFNAYYDSESSSVKMKSMHGNHTEEYLREFLAEFPVFF